MRAMSAPAAYTLGSTDAELRRLIALATHEETHVVAACRRAAVSDGAIVADFGCGPLGALRGLARVVGDRGSVIGIDASAHALETARGLMQEWPNVRLVQADVHDVSLDPLGVDGLDAVYSRLMLLHQPDPDRVVRRMFDLLRPRGVVMAHEPSDLPEDAPASEPACPALRRVWELVIGAARLRGARTNFGPDGRRYLTEAGFAVEHSGSYRVHYPPEIGFEIPRVALGSLRPVIEGQLATAGEIAALDHLLQEMKSREDVQWVSSPLMFEWIARKTV
jgi:SAM-dependent methyltransferase